MIVGLLLLFVAIFLIQLTSSIKKEQLTGQQEKVFGNLFQKEGLRIGVEDCFHDILEEGIVLLGKQGRIWKDQPGGSLEFVEGVTGTTPPGSKDRIAYAITNEIYPPDQTQHENPYPCDEFNSDQPCPYIFPDSQYGFGEIQLRKDVIEKDLLSYTKDQIKPCVEKLITSKTNPNIKITSDELELNIKIENDGINVQVKYPLTLKLGGEELFHIANFDFFYDSLFKSFLDSAIVFPLQWDQKFVDFDYSENQLKNLTFTYASRKEIKGESCILLKDTNYFECKRKLFNEKFNSLDISLEKEEIKNGKGDDLFIFTLPASNILEKMPGKYTFQFARQNRPPALDYINRSGCPEKGYDYLVIPDDKELGNIDIQLNAKDADEDTIKEYRFDSVSTLVKGTWPGQYILDGQNKNYAGNHLVIDPKHLQDPSSQIRVFSARAQDEHGAEDNQEIRVLIDRPIETSFLIDLPYTFNSGTAAPQKYSEKFDNTKGYAISLEDPFLITITLPEKSNQNDVTQSVFLTYANKDNKQDTFTWTEKDFPHNGEKTFRFSPKLETDNFNDLKEKDIQNIPPSLFQQITQQGKLKISFSAAYCPDKEGKTKNAETSQEATLQVKECTPNENPEHPNPYIIGKDYYKLFFKKDQTGKYTNLNGEQEEISPFLAFHKCCNTDWTFKKENTVCYEEPPQLGCFGGSTEAKGTTGQLLEKKTYTYFCPGDRGNICGGKGHENYVYESQKTCGKSTCDQTDTECNAQKQGCSNIASECEGKSIWYYQTGPNGFFCDGDVGCGKSKQACTSIAVDINSDSKLGEGDQCNCNSKNEGKNCLDLKLNKWGGCEGSGAGAHCAIKT